MCAQVQSGIVRQFRGSAHPDIVATIEEFFVKLSLVFDWTQFDRPVGGNTT
jgi:hypothetical protein